MKKRFEKFNESRISSLVYTLLSLIIFLIIAIIFTKIGFFTKPFINQLINSILEMLRIVLLLLAVFALTYVIIGFFGKKYSLRVDNFNIAGINVFFDKSSEIYIKAVGSFLMSKRTLFNFNPKRDNIDEVLDSYYSVYNYIRENLELLDQEDDGALYLISIETLKKLNNFLTKHQNDYRRWYKKNEKENKINVGDGKTITVHNTTIEEVQKHYYRYDEILKDFNSINVFFKSNEFQDSFKINSIHWRNEEDA